MQFLSKIVVSVLVFWLIFCQSAGGQSIFTSANKAEGSEGRNVGDSVKLVKRQVGSGRSAGGIFNTTLAFTIPLFSFTLPDKRQDLTTREYTKQAALSLLGLGLVGGLAVIPYIYAAAGRARNSEFEGRGDSEGSSIVSMASQIASLAGLHHQECFSRSICEVYRQPERYGVLVLPLRYILMQPKLRQDDGTSDYETAAEYGRSNGDECDRRYRCAFSLVGAADFLIAYIFPKSN